jgi:hypothetical protein
LSVSAFQDRLSIRVSFICSAPSCCIFFLDLEATGVAGAKTQLAIGAECPPQITCGILATKTWLVAEARF